MHFSAIALTIAVAAIVSTSASAAAPRALVSVNQASSSLLSRAVPAACVSTCTPVQNAETTCVQATCMCSGSFSSQLSDCVNCRLKADPTLRSNLTTSWDEYSSDCATMGLPVSGGIDGATTTASSAAPAVSTTPAASVDRNGVAHANAAPNLHARGILGLLVVGVVAALL